MKAMTLTQPPVTPAAFNAQRLQIQNAGGSLSDLANWLGQQAAALGFERTPAKDHHMRLVTFSAKAPGAASEARRAYLAGYDGK